MQWWTFSVVIAVGCLTACSRDSSSKGGDGDTNTGPTGDSTSSDSGGSSDEGDSGTVSGDTDSAKDTRGDSASETETSGEDPETAEVPGSISPDAIYYVREGASGDGSSWTDALPNLPAVLSRGDLYYIADGTYGGYTFDDPESGEAYIHIRKATPADHGTDDGWEDAFGDGRALWNELVFASSFYLFDGARGGGPGAWDTDFGFEVVASWTEAERNGRMVRLESDVHHIRIRHADFHPEVTHRGFGVAFHGSDGQYAVHIDHCWAHDIFGVFLLTRSCSRFLLEYNYFLNNLNTSEWHSEFSSDVGSDDMVFRFNRFEEIQGTAVFAGVNGNADNPHERWAIYGNVFRNNRTHIVRYYWTENDDENEAVDWVFYNNTIMGDGTGSGNVLWDQYRNVSVTNNLWYNYRAPDYLGFPVEITQYNGFHQCDFLYAVSENMDTETNTVSDTEPFLSPVDDRFELAGPTEPGASLPEPYQHDMYGHRRGEDGNWDRGAVEWE